MSRTTAKSIFRSRIAGRAAVAVAAVGALGIAAVVPAGAQVDVDVAVDNTGGSRTLYIEDLKGQSLSELDFGNNRSLPFRARVVDSTMDRAGFSVSAAMTKLYLDDGGTLDHSTAIHSQHVSLAGAGDPLNVLDPEALVEPVFDVVSEISDSTICNLLGLPVVDGVCTIEASDVVGLTQTVPLDVDLSDLSNLPLLPQSAEPGAFDDPSFAGVGADDPDASGAPAATTRRLVAGSPVEDSTVLSNVEAALGDVLSGLTVTEKIDEAVLIGALRDAVGPAWDLLSDTQVDTVIAATVATVQNLAADALLAQSGTYMSFPLLNVLVPDGTPGGTFQGTLVITGLE